MSLRWFHSSIVFGLIYIALVSIGTVIERILNNNFMSLGLTIVFVIISCSLNSYIFIKQNQRYYRQDELISVMLGSGFFIVLVDFSALLPYFRQDLTATMISAAVVVTNHILVAAIAYLLICGRLARKL